MITELQSERKKKEKKKRAVSVSAKSKLNITSGIHSRVALKATFDKIGLPFTFILTPTLTPYICIYTYIY